MFQIEFTPQAVDDLQPFRRFDQQRILAEIEGQLTSQATNETRHRKRLRPNRLAEWELRVGDFRIFYGVDGESMVVKVVAVGIKHGDKLFLHGEEYEL